MQERSDHPWSFDFIQTSLNSKWLIEMVGVEYASSYMLNQLRFSECECQITRILWNLLNSVGKVLQDDVSSRIAVSPSVLNYFLSTGRVYLLALDPPFTPRQSKNTRNCKDA
jgi:hypothetical protein